MTIFYDNEIVAKDKVSVVIMTENVKCFSLRF